MLVFFVAIILFHFALIFRKDVWLVILLVIFANKFLFLIPTESTHVENIGELSDVAIALGLFYTVALPSYRTKLWQLRKSKIGKVILLLSLMTVVTCIVTSLRYGESIVLSMRMGRVYLYYLMFFVFGALLHGSGALKRAGVGFLSLCLIFSVLYIIQTFLPVGFLLYPGFVWENWSFAGLTVNRLYMDYFEYYAGMMFLITFVGFLLERKRRAFLGIVSAVFFVQVLLTQHRNLWFTVVTGLVVALFVLYRTRIFPVRNIVFALTGIILFFSVALSSVGSLEGITERIIEGFADTPLAGGTFTGRLIESEKYLTRIVENFVLGVGLIHPMGGTLGTTEGKEYFSELGNLGFVFHFGISGLIIVGLLAYAFGRTVNRVLSFRKYLEPLQIAAVIGIYSCFWGTIFLFVLNGGFSMYSGVVLFSFAFAYVEVTYRNITKEIDTSPVEGKDPSPVALST